MKQIIIISLAILGLLSLIDYNITYSIHKYDNKLADNKDVRILRTIMYGLFILFSFFSLSIN